MVPLRAKKEAGSKIKLTLRKRGMNGKTMQVGMDGTEGDCLLLEILLARCTHIHTYAHENTKQMNKNEIANRGNWLSGVHTHTHTNKKKMTHT